jgi:hypothetical protein
MNNNKDIVISIEFIGIREEMHNPDFKPTEFGRFRNESGSNGFVMTPEKWIEASRRTWKTGNCYNEKYPDNEKSATFAT